MTKYSSKYFEKSIVLLYLDLAGIDSITPPIQGIHSANPRRFSSSPT